MPKPAPTTQTGSLTDHQHGTDDAMVVAVGAQTFFGDALSLFDHARGGDDTLIGADPLFNILNGDAGQMHDHTRGGTDHLIGADNSFNFLIGDASTMDGHSRGGNDALAGGLDAFNELFGDAYSMSGNAHGGNDTLIADSGSSLYGDAFSLSGDARGGDDILVSGKFTDNLWGDAQVIAGDKVSTGADTFIFAPDSGTDYIHDFRPSDHDKIDVSAYGFHDISDMTIGSNISGDTVIAFDAADRVVLVGFGGTLHGSDFIFA